MFYNPTQSYEDFDPKVDPFEVMERTLDEWADLTILAMFEALDMEEDGDALHDCDIPQLTDADREFLSLL